MANVSIGLTYTTPQDVNHRNVLQGSPLLSPGGPPTLNSLSLSSPNNLGVGGGLGGAPQEAPHRDADLSG